MRAIKTVWFVASTVSTIIVGMYISAVCLWTRGVSKGAQDI